MLFSSTRISSPSTGGSGGGNITGTIAATQVAFGAGPDDIIGNANFTYDTALQNFHVGFPGNSFIDINATSQQYYFGDIGNQHDLHIDSLTGTTTINSYGIQQLSVSDSTGIQQFGDIGGDWNFDLLKIDGSNRTITLQDSGARYLLIDVNTPQYFFGDIDNTSAGISMGITSADFSIYDTALGGHLLNIATSAGYVYNIGDLDGNHNNSVLTLNDSHKSLDFIVGGNNYLKVNVETHRYELGDNNDAYNQTRLRIYDNLSTATINGMQSDVILTGPTGPAGFDTPDTDTFTGTSPQTYHIDDQGNNGQVIEEVTWVGGIPIVGDPITGDTTLATGLIAAIDNTNPGTVYIFVTSGDFTGETSLTSSWSGTIAGTISPIVDTYTVLINGVITTPYAIPMWTTAVPDINGLMLTWSTFSFPPGSSWDFSLTFDVGLMFEADGQAHKVTIGDITPIRNGTRIEISDDNFNIRPFNRWVGGMGSPVASGNNLKLGDGGNKFHITGTTTINDIQVSNWEDGSEVTLIFDSALTVQHNIPPSAGFARILLAGSGNFAAAPNSRLILMYDKTNIVTGTSAWLELARTTA